MTSRQSDARVLVWWQGARPRTLGAAVVPVVVGTAAVGRAHALRSALLLVVALGLQIGVNYANDYFDGVRGVDTVRRVGPQRMTAGGLASPRAVAAAAGAAFAVAALAGLALALMTDLRLLGFGALAILAAVGYSGGPRPYAGLGLGEVSVFVFFGVVAVCGSAWVQSGSIPRAASWSAVPVGLLAVAILVANNLRDIATDAAAGKRTLAVRVGDRPTRSLYGALVVASFAAVGAGAALGRLPVATLITLAAVPAALPPLRAVRTGSGAGLVPVLLGTARLHLLFGALLAGGLLWR